jgi:hypothetical protein
MIFHVILPLQVDELYSLDLDALKDLQYVILATTHCHECCYRELAMSNNCYHAGQFMGL